MLTDTPALSSLASLYSDLLSAPKPLLGGGFAPSVQRWLYADKRFASLLKNMCYTPTQLEDYRTKLAGLERCLNAKYWPDKTLNDITFIITGSWLKNTPVRTCSDIDVIFLLPYSVYTRYSNRTGNIQSDLLQEIKQTLLSSWYCNTDVKGDGPTVVVDFSTVKIEIAPAFLDPSGSRIISDWNFKTLACYTNDNGRYGLAAPIAESLYMIQVNQANKGYLIPLIKMLKVWKKYCNVPIKTMALQMMAERFIPIWDHRNAQYFWPDWLIRDFFAYMVTQNNKSDFFPLTNETLHFGCDWLSRAETAAAISAKACDYEEKSYNTLAGEQWQRLFGNMIPKEVK